MKLSNEDKKILISMGYIENDLPQIQELKYEFHQEMENGSCKKITQTEAEKILSREDFLSGIARSAFHGLATRNTISIKSNLFD